MSERRFFLKNEPSRGETYSDPGYQDHVESQPDKSDALKSIDVPKAAAEADAKGMDAQARH